MGGLAWAHRAWGLPEGDLEGLRGEGSQFSGPPNPGRGAHFLGKPSQQGWKSGGSHSLQEKIKATSAAAAAVTVILRCGGKNKVRWQWSVFECMHRER